MSTLEPAAAHQVLRTPELQTLIFDHIEGCSRDEREGFYIIPREIMLVRLALVCKTFMEPALAVLWTNLPNLKPILDVLPRDCCNSDRVCPPQLISINEGLIRNVS